jgi:dihydrofolate synthase/folylpolyglutamate synthase
MTYPQTLDYMYSQLPMFTRVGAIAFKAGLGNTLELCQLLGNPQDSFKSVHIGGTNGKGSTSHMLAAILQVAGYKTGLYTSPHLRDFRERIRINGEMISEQTVVDFVERYRFDFDSIQPSFFEMTVGMAFDFFAKEQVDIAVIEVGLGGRLDSTNVITPLLSVITNIGWDHMNMLGDTLPLIAAEKAGIIKPGIPVIIGEHQSEVAKVFIDAANKLQAPLEFASLQLQVHAARPHISNAPEHLPVTVNQDLELHLDLTGTYQIKNVATVLCAIEHLRAQGFTITDNHIAIALKHVKTLTGLRGRWDILAREPLVIADTGHNPEGIAEVMANIKATPHKQLHFVLGMVNDKDHSKVLNMLPKGAVYYFCQPNIPRGLSAQSLKQKAEIFGLKGEVFTSVEKAYIAAKNAASADDLVFIGGSTFVVAEVI